MNIKYKSYYNPLKPFHVVDGCGTGSVSLLLRKSLYVFLYRLFRYGETNRLVCDSRGVVIVYNKIEELVRVIDGTRKIHGKYHYNHVEWDSSEYNHAWFGGMYQAQPTTEKALIEDPYHFWVKGYKAHFYLESPFGKRKHCSYWRK